MATLAEQGIDRFIQISAIGADAGSASAYARGKAEGEAAILAACPQAHVLRPSIVVGPEDDFSTALRVWRKLRRHCRLSAAGYALSAGRRF